MTKRRTWGVFPFMYDDDPDSPRVELPAPVTVLAPIPEPAVIPEPIQEPVPPVNEEPPAA